MTKIGDIVEINMAGEWIERTYVMDGRDSGVLVVKLGDKQKYLNGEPFSTVWYSFDEWRAPRKCNRDCSCNSRKECEC
jgi:hypothetical protein